MVGAELLDDAAALDTSGGRSSVIPESSWPVVVAAVVVSDGSGCLVGPDKPGSDPAVVGSSAVGHGADDSAARFETCLLYTSPSPRD